MPMACAGASTAERLQILHEGPSLDFPEVMRLFEAQLSDFGI
jgi:hypothetical protein